MSVRPRRTRLTLLATAGALLAAAVPAHAGALVADAPDCASLSNSQVFSPWADPAYYEAAPGGSMEQGAGSFAAVSGGAAIVDGNEPYSVGDAGDSHALSLPDGGSVTTHPTCVGLNKPDVRFFARRVSGGLGATLKVEAAIEDNAGNVTWVTIGVTPGTVSWQPTAPMVLTPALLPLLPGSETPTALRFSATNASFVIDDVYIDPYGGH